MQLIYGLIARIHWGVAAVVGGVTRGVLYTQSRLPVRLRLSVGFSLLAAVACWLSVASAKWLAARAALLGMPDDLLERFRDTGWPSEYSRFCTFAAGVAVACGLAVLLVWIRHRLVHTIARYTVAAYAVMWVWLAWFIAAVPSELYDLDRELYGKATRNEHWIALGGVWLLLTALPFLMFVGLGTERSRRLYGRDATSRPGWADGVLERLRGRGGDPRFRSSLYYAVALLLLILATPILMRGCSNLRDPYGLIKGRGEPAVQVVVRVKEKKKKKTKKLLVNPWSPYIFEQPDIDDIQVIHELDQETADTYVAQTGKTGKLGTGGPGSGGWPHGLTDGKIGFIRLEYDGGDWDQDMGKGADYNLLLRFREITGFKIADNTEHMPISDLKRFPKDRAPPFVFLTGKGRINVSSQDVKSLRWYCLEEGGCLFIDNGGGTFHSAMTGLLRRVFPDKSLREIANDDPVFQAPFAFRNGAPPLWHHAGRRAKGIRHNGRWVVFYHPGDMNDAWKSGHSGADPVVAEQAYRLGINVMYYTFNQYHRIHFEE